MLSAFGKFVRKLRIDNGEILKDMANKLGVTSSYLSAVENNKRKVPHHWTDIIIHDYSLDEFQTKQLRRAVDESLKVSKVNINDLDNSDKDLVMELARKLRSKDLNKDSKEQIISIMFDEARG